MMAEQHWIVKRADKEYAAPSIGMLQEWAKAGSLASTDMIWHPDRGDWVAVSDVPGLALHVVSNQLTRSATPLVNSGQTVVIVSTKNVGLAVALALAFGPLGLFYSSIAGGVTMIFVNLFVGVVTLGFGLFLTWPICGLWAFLAASRYNENIISGQRSY